MRLLLLAIFLSISFHLIIISSIKTKNDSNNNEKTSENMEKVESKITYVKLKEKEIEIKKEKTKKIFKDNIKKDPYKKIVKKQTIQSEQKLQNKVLREQIVNKKTSIQNKTLEDFLSQKEPIDEKLLNEIDYLYKKEFETFTSIQKAFIKENLNSFRRITQTVLNRLGYPHLARKMRISGENIVSFYFHPNGDISELKITSSSNYSVFDDYTLELIQIAYKDYPKPKTKTKLIFNVRYILY